MEPEGDDSTESERQQSAEAEIQQAQVRSILVSLASSSAIDSKMKFRVLCCDRVHVVTYTSLCSPHAHILHRVR